MGSIKIGFNFLIERNYRNKKKKEISKEVNNNNEEIIDARTLYQTFKWKIFNLQSHFLCTVEEKHK